MNDIKAASVLVLLSILVAVAVAPDAMADHATATVSNAEGSSVPGCEVTNECFIPNIVTIDAGGEVTWLNPDTAAHTITSGTTADGADRIFDSGLVSPGVEFKHVFEEAGEYPYFCLVHPWMSGMVIVQSAMAEDADKDMHMETDEPSGMTMLSDGTEVVLKVTTPTAGESMRIEVAFRDREHTNYDIMVMQGDMVVLDVTGAHEHMGMGTHITDQLASDEPVDVTVTFQGYGVNEITGPQNEKLVFVLVSEFGTEYGVFNALGGASGVAVSEIGGRTYALVTGSYSNGVQVIDITNPKTPIPVSSIFHGQDGFDALDYARDIAVAEIGGRTYALVIGTLSGGIQVIDITNPKTPIPVSSVFHGQDGFDALDYAGDIAVTEIGGRTYALVTDQGSDGVQVIDITNPKTPIPVSSIFHGQDGFDALSIPGGIAVSEIDSRVYALVTGELSDGIQVIDITNPKTPIPVSSVFTVGDVIVSYEEANDPIHYGLRMWLADNEDTIIDANSITNYLALQNNIHVAFESCGQANAWHIAAIDKITICYELAEKYTTIFRESDIDAPYGVANALHWVFMHELGHAVIDMYDLPITGQEEDAADQFATIMLLRGGTEGAHALLSIVNVYANSVNYTPFWDTHSFDLQRYYNMLCLLYGKHQGDDIGWYAEGLIPESRAIGCAEEYKDAVNAWSILLDDYVHAPQDLENVMLTDTDAETAQEQIVVTADDDPVLGSESAPIVIIEFSDFQCPFCARFHTETLPLIKENYIDTGKVKLVYRDFPIQNIHPNAMVAAVAAECADEQGVFWDYHDTLFEGMSQWKDLSVDAAISQFKAYASDVGTDRTMFDDCVDTGKYINEVAGDYADGVAYGITGTPAFFLGNDQIGYHHMSGAKPYNEFQFVIEQLLSIVER